MIRKSKNICKRENINLLKSKVVLHRKSLESDIYQTISGLSCREKSE